MIYNLLEQQHNIRDMHQLVSAAKRFLQPSRTDSVMGMAAHLKSFPHWEQQCASSIAMRVRRWLLCSFSSLDMNRLAFTIFSGVAVRRHMITTFQ